MKKSLGLKVRKKQGYSGGCGVELGQTITEVLWKKYVFIYLFIYFLGG